MDAQTYQDIFTSLGQLIGFRNAATSFNTTNNQVRALTMTALITNYFNEVNKIQPALQSMLVSIQSQNTNLAQTIDSIISSYMLQVVKPLLGSSSTSATAVVTDLIADMQYPLGSESVLTDGKFYTYFYNTYGQELPEEAVPTIADTLAD